MVVLYSGTETVAAGILTHYNYMMPEENQKIAQELLSSAGIEIDGNNPWDIRVHDKRTFGRIFREGSLGLGESYMDGWWDVKKLDDYMKGRELIGIYPTDASSERIREVAKRCWGGRYEKYYFNCQKFIDDITMKQFSSDLYSYYSGIILGTLGITAFAGVLYLALRKK